VRKEVQGRRKRHKCERILAEKGKEKMESEKIRMRKQKKGKISGQREKHYKVKSVRYKKSRII
jgi:hypothetical protein